METKEEYIFKKKDWNLVWIENEDEAFVFGGEKQKQGKGVQLSHIGPVYVLFLWPVFPRSATENITTA